MVGERSVCGSGSESFRAVIRRRRFGRQSNDLVKTKTFHTAEKKGRRERPATNLVEVSRRMVAVNTVHKQLSEVFSQKSIRELALPPDSNTGSRVTQFPCCTS
jgi:hypothetical protein